MFLREDIERQRMLDSFIDFVCEYLHIDRPLIELVDGVSWPEEHRTFGTYSPSDKSIKVATEGRHFMDILRTLAHEMVHRQQFTYRESWTQDDMDDLESDANTVAAQIMREYGKKHPQLFTFVAEEAPVNAASSGAIAGIGIGPDGEPGVKKRKKTLKMFKRGIHEQLNGTSSHSGVH